MTEAFPCDDCGYDISTHTPVRVWQIGVIVWIDEISFQLTHPWGCDSVRWYGYVPERFQHTHPWWCDGVQVRITETFGEFQLTHPWGCDLKNIGRSRSGRNFNSHTREGVTWLFTDTFRNLGNFNSHTREGVTNSWGDVPKYANFNSHTREGVTNAWPNASVLSRFQLTHPWGCDNNYLEELNHVIRFQLTHPWGCDGAEMAPQTKISVFQLTHPWGCDGRTCLQLNKIDISTHTPVRVWQWRLWCNWLYCSFQLTHPWGCDLS